MTRSIDAVATSAQIKATYRRYLQSLLAVRDPLLDAALRRAIDTTSLLDKGPYLEATPPYAPGATAHELIDEGVLASGFTRLASNAMPMDRPLYVHQERAIRKVAAGRNVVVATGTGSGKTESFLLPILDRLVREDAEGTLGPGVRALLLYPMNALANDQLKRLRQLLATYPAITFGRYTGDTEHDPVKARERFGELNIGEPILPNELLSRTEMRATPPHLLLTNYAMLEYLLLRPSDLQLFGSGGTSTWRFIVVDEAHVYDGTQGAEIAMLLRRVRDRVAPGSALQCIATSATVGGDSEPSTVTKFASSLFDQPFESVDGDPSRQDLITAERLPAPEGPYWGPLTAADYIRLLDEPDHDAAIGALASKAGFSSSPGAGATIALSHEQALATLRSTLASGPKRFDSVVEAVFGKDPHGPAGLAAAVKVASSLRNQDGTAVLSARYHLFLRATEGAFTCLSPNGPHVHLARHDLCPECDTRVFELGSCKRCGAVHIVGSSEIVDGVIRLRPRKATEKGTWLVLGDQPELIDEDEEAVADEGRGVTGNNAKLCAKCGSLNDSRATACADRSCRASDLRPVRRLNQKGDEIAGCLVCGARGAGTVRIFETGADASGAVITTSLYQCLPPGSDPREADLPGEGRKLLAFSDSRQAAAYFAPYLEDSYLRLQRRRLISQGLIASGADEEPVGIEDLSFETRKAAKRTRVFPGRLTAQQELRQVAPWVMAEVLATDDRQSLEGLGLASIALYRDRSWQVPKPLLDLGLGPGEAWAFLQELVRTLRQQGAVSMPEDVPPNHEIFAPRLGPIRARLSGPESVRKVLSWLPGKGTNRRVDYTRRVLTALNVDTDAIALLKGIWAFLTNPNSPVDWLRSSTEHALGIAYQVDHELLRLVWVSERNPVHQCTTCRRISPFTVRGVCPALSCDGTLAPFVPLDLDDDIDHYRSIYRSMNAVPLSAKEHTAQWSNVEAASIQQDFIRGRVNALSCSTTFELGVDVGELQAVMLRNMPPNTANYIQRAGRAGRRSGSAALVVTYANRRSHDLTHFAEPEVMMSGVIRAPYVPLVNARINRRHAHSVALAEFFRWYFASTNKIERTAGGFFLPDESAPTVSLIKGFLSPVPTEITKSLMRILPAQIAHELGVESGIWASHLIDLLEDVRRELAADVSELEHLRDEAAEAKNFQLAERYQQVGNTLRRRDLLGFLANHNVLPKYGFPTDSVELRTAFGLGKHLGSSLDLTRDLSAAIHEYAPDATLVAGGKLWTSRGIYRLPGRDLEEFNYYVCKRCGGFRQAVADVDTTCSYCGAAAEATPRKLTIPEFGFVADKEPKNPGPRPPMRSWSGATHILKHPPEGKTRQLRLPGGSANVRVGPRGRLIAVADGPGGRGFWICDWCGHGSARVASPQKGPAHKHLLRDIDCNGPQHPLDLAHSYETDLLTLDLRVAGFVGNQDAWHSVLYAIVEAACETLEIGRDDIGGSLTPTGIDRWEIVLFDAVPGGAGHVLMIEQRLESVFNAALRRVSLCDCGPETSCYGCLRSYSNQREHDVLSRGAAEQILRRLIDDTGQIDAKFALRPI
ncbi:DEAD/DEAH box helicase [Amycolatopsis mediterranei]|uniref:DEAD/DEAH box helicase n=2 Tax=Amycolatopsis mediterranei TaxID=33910 RepID=A0A0H3DJY4_AMYMU|nr:DEAD/DEAH box helicase [Amycolatopsis mediterranei]ADJ50004.1 DEAD/DEAH box helicase [Amycolatopsis mediterranei U32]AEK47000.1 DEAD/DEAH box helicase [Amycolatopsis mediterranei S699]AGT88841.1 DEAD/DEAH box helicase [Amycolatopsis mediterranei RB]KDO07748.1 DEAD/DEAH box helicase [Amycolatopsis mediterranei]KDU93359.1 DEAD/DEAH box helicase [Amycolatopsis mediterranei]